MRKVDLLRSALADNITYPGVFLDKAEGVASYGDQWFDSGLPNTGDYIFEDEVMLFAITTPAGDGNWLFGGRALSAYTLGVFIGSSGVFNGYGGGTAAGLPLPKINEWLTIYFSRKRLTVNNNSYRVNGGSLVPAEYERSILVGRIDLNYVGTAQDPRMLYGRRRRFRVGDAITLELLRDYRAFLHDDGRYGFWEMVSNEFVDSLGSPFEP